MPCAAGPWRKCHDASLAPGSCSPARLPPPKLPASTAACPLPPSLSEPRRHHWQRCSLPPSHAANWITLWSPQAKGEACRECVEKQDYIAKIRQVFGLGTRDEL